MRKFLAHATFWIAQGVFWFLLLCLYIASQRTLRIVFGMESGDSFMLWSVIFAVALVASVVCAFGKQIKTLGIASLLISVSVYLGYLSWFCHEDQMIKRAWERCDDAQARSENSQAFVGEYRSSPKSYPNADPKDFNDEIKGRKIIVKARESEFDALCDRLEHGDYEDWGNLLRSMSALSFTLALLTVVHKRFPKTFSFMNEMK